MVGFLKLVVALVVAVLAASLLFAVEMSGWQYASSAATGGEAMSAVGVGGLMGYGAVFVLGALIAVVALPLLGVLRLAGKLTGRGAMIIVPLVLLAAGVAFIVVAGASQDSWPLLSTLVLPGALAGWLLWRIGLRPRAHATAG